MAPFKSSLGRSLGKLLGVSNQRDLILRGAKFNDRPAPAKASGGSITNGGDGYIYHTFYANVPSPYSKSPNTSETFINFQPLTVDYLIIGGGGAGGYADSSNTGAGGGGAGKVHYKTGVPLTAGTYPVTVGGGGDAAPSAASSGSANDGDASVFNSVTATGGGAGGYGNGSGDAGRNGGSAGGGGANGSSATTPSPGTASGVPHPAGSNDLASPPSGWGTAGGYGGGDSLNLSAGGGGGGASTIGLNGQSGPNPPGYSQGGAGGAGATYTVVLNGGTVALKNIGGGGAGGSYSKTGVNPPAFNYGGGIQDLRNWDSPLLIYPTTSQRYTGLDGTGGGGTGGASSSGFVPGGGPGTSRSGRGGCGLVQIRYLA